MTQSAEAAHRLYVHRGRKREVRALTINNKRTWKYQLDIIREELRGVEYERPHTRAECLDGVRPCPFVGCRYNLFLDINPSGNIKLNFPDLEPDEMTCSCVLDIADAGPQTLERVGELLNITRERMRQLEELALRKIARRMDDEGFGYDDLTWISRDP